MKVKYWFLFLVAAALVIWQVGFSGTNDPGADLIFNHSLHLTEAGAECATCHSGAPISTQPEDSLTPKMSVCSACHDIQDPKGCSACHQDPNQVKPLPAQVENYEVFSHKKHFGSGLNCQDCHAKAVQSTQVTSEQTLLPRMMDCLNCHQKKGQTTECAGCHYGKYAQAGDLDFMTWRQIHGLEAATDPEHYRKYFEPGECDNCHQGLNLAGEVHQQGWLFTHGAEASAGGECLVCHEDRTYCSSCHRRLLPLPHPVGPAWAAETEEGGAHVSEAKAYLEACISCHDVGNDDPTCVRCHQ
jgi:hypothetical protein